MAQDTQLQRRIVEEVPPREAALTRCLRRSWHLGSALVDVRQDIYEVFRKRQDRPRSLSKRMAEAGNRAERPE